MPVFSISYDLMAPGKNYQPLYDELNRLGAQRLLLSQRAVRLTADTTAATLVNHLRGFVDANDRIVVIQIDGIDWASIGALTDINTV